MFLHQVVMMVYLSFRATFRDQTQGLRTLVGVVSAQIYFTGVQALPLTAVLSFFMGALISFQFQAQVSFIGNAAYIGNLMVMVIFRELAPLATALIVVARSGTAVASEIGAMKAHKEFDALEVMGIHPLSYVVFPRLVGGVVSVVGLAIFFCGAATLGGFVFCHWLLGMPLAFYVESLISALTLGDVGLILGKNILSGALIFVVCCHQGFSVQGSPHEIPQATTRAVVRSLLLVTLVNFTLSGLFYVKHFLDRGLL